MTLLAPWALWFLAVAGAVVALYLLKIKRRQATVPALDFWLALAGRTKVHSLFDRLKRLLSMLLWLLIAGCLILALGNPILSWGRIKPRAIAVVIDNSASMQTREARAGNESGGDAATESRLDQARAAIAELTSSRPVTDQWLLIEAGREARVLQPWTYDAKAVRASVTDVRPFGGAADLRSAIDLAGQLLAGKPDPCIVVVSDGAGGELEALAKADPRIMPWPIGKARDNLGITRLAVRADRQRGTYHTLISIVNSSSEQVQTQVTLSVNTAAYSVELVAVEPGATWEKTIIIDPPGDSARTGAVLHAQIDRADALALDNEAFAILQPLRPAVVWLVSAPDTSFFFEQALGAMDPMVWTEESLTMPLEQYERVAGVLNGAQGGAGGDAEAEIKRPDLVVFNNCAPATLPQRGRFVMLNAWPKALQTNVVGTLETPQLFLAPKPHPITDHVTLQGARLARASRITLGEPAKVLAHTADGDPLVMLFEHADRQCLVTAFDVLDSDLPFRNAFPLMLRNTVAFMHEDAPGFLPPETRIGERLHPSRPLPGEITETTLAVLRDGETTEVPVPVAERSFAFTDTGRAGAVRLTVGDEVSYSAISLAAAAESRIAPIALAPEEEPAERLSLSRGVLALGGVPWVGLAFLAAFLIVFEWLTFHFRWTE